MSAKAASERVELKLFFEWTWYTDVHQFIDSFQTKAEKDGTFGQ